MMLAWKKKKKQMRKCKKKNLKVQIFDRTFPELAWRKHHFASCSVKKSLRNVNSSSSPPPRFLGRKKTFQASSLVQAVAAAYTSFFSLSPHQKVFLGEWVGQEGSRKPPIEQDFFPSLLRNLYKKHLVQKSVKKNCLKEGKKRLRWKKKSDFLNSKLLLCISSHP